MYEIITMQLSTIRCTIWEKLKVPSSNSYKIYFRGEPMIVDSQIVTFFVSTDKDILCEISKLIDMRQFTKILIENQ